MSDIKYGTMTAVDTNDMITIGTATTLTGSGSIYATTGASTINIRPRVDELLDKREMNLLVVEHKVSEVEMMKLKEVQPDFADVIKDNIAKKAAKEVTRKMTFTKKKLPDEDTHHFLGRVYVFTKEELVQLIEEAQNA